MNWDGIERALGAVLELPDEQRDTFVSQQPPDVRAEVEALLAAYRRSGGFLGNETGTRPAAADLLRTMLASGAGAPSGLTGQTVSHYQIQEMLGAGGMGVVYKAFDTKLGRPVALKFLPPGLRYDEELKQQLKAEARAASALAHPNIVVIHDIDEGPGGEMFIAMAFHDGETLRDRIRRAPPMPLSDALRIARDVASGLAKAHEHGIIHRDIKPANIIVGTDGVARIIDFGLAKSSDATATMGSTRGTPVYMSPEQASGKAVDSRTDLWSLGAVLYEMLAGQTPFRGETQLQVMHAIVHDHPARLREFRPDVPAGVEAIVSRALQKDPANRYASAAEMVHDLLAAISDLEGARTGYSTRRTSYAVAALAVVIVAATISVWLYQRSEKRHWAREQAIPEIARLAGQNQPLAAFQLLKKAEGYLSGDPQLTQIAESLTHTASVRSTPLGATVEIQDYLSLGDAWFALGTTPLDHVRIPNGYLRWRVRKSGAEYVGAPIASDIHGPVREFSFPLEAIPKAPEGMVPVPAGKYEDYIWSIGDLGPFALPAFYIDRFEVTNRQYQEFVDRGGYQKRDYWKEKVLRNGQELSWEQAMEMFRDSTGRPGPSTWEAGHYPAGKADYPVGGVSWYEATAYAEFAGKTLPTIAQWYLAAPSSVAKWITRLSNFSGSQPAPVGKYQGVGPWGTYDMGGNIAEWCRNEGGGGTRYILGGAWTTSSAEYWEPATLPPFDRSANGGFRCVRNMGPLPPEAAAEVRIMIRDFSKAKPAPDEVFKIYRTMYAYDHTPLNMKTEALAQDSADWRKEKVTFDAAYGNERMAAYLFLPAKVRPPYQTVVFFPSARVLDIADSKTLGDMNYIDYVIQSGRAVLYPVYKGTYERPGPDNTPNTTAGRDETIAESKDVGRSMDYLETRADIDRNKIVYMGVSMGAALGVIFATVEDRFKGAIFLDGGFYGEKLLPGTDQADFAPRLKMPVLLVGGKYDWIFLGKDALLRMFGTPAADKRAVTLETAHDVSEQRTELMREVLGFLDKYLGRVN